MFKCEKVSKESEDSAKRDMLEKARKHANVVAAICKNYKDSGGANNEKFCRSINDLQNFMAMAPVCRLPLPRFIRRSHFEGQTLSLTGAQFWSKISRCQLQMYYTPQEQQDDNQDDTKKEQLVAEAHIKLVSEK